MRYSTILLVDDDVDDQEFFREALLLISKSLSCTTADNGKKALQFLEQATQLPDIIFLDWNMPVMNGAQFLEEIKNRSSYKDIPVIIISTSSHGYTRDAAFELGADHFITKPTNFQDLVEAVRGVVLG